MRRQVSPHAHSLQMSLLIRILRRVTDDFFPDDAAPQACHTCACAFSGLFLSELFIGDWDMFHSKHPVRCVRSPW